MQRSILAGGGALLKGAEEVYFSVASIWEVAIKQGTDKPEFRVDPHLFRRGLMDEGYVELAIKGEHAARWRACRGCTRILSTGCWWLRRRWRGSRC